MSDNSAEDMMENVMPETMHEVCPECDGGGMMHKPNDAMMPCPRCAADRMMGKTPKGSDTKYKSLMSEMK